METCIEERKESRKNMTSSGINYIITSTYGFTGEEVREGAEYADGILRVFPKEQLTNGFILTCRGDGRRMLYTTNALRDGEGKIVNNFDMFWFPSEDRGTLNYKRKFIFDDIINSEKRLLDLASIVNHLNRYLDGEKMKLRIAQDYLHHFPTTMNLDFQGEFDRGSYDIARKTIVAAHALSDLMQ